MTWLRSAESLLPQVWPPELPSESTPDFWFTACKYEMSARDGLSEKLRLVIQGKESPPMTLLEAWLFRRRLEWAAQVALAKAKEGVEPNALRGPVFRGKLRRSGSQSRATEIRLSRHPIRPFPDQGNLNAWLSPGLSLGAC